jgi:hypothetical protein
MCAQVCASGRAAHLGGSLVSGEGPRSGCSHQMASRLPSMCFSGRWVDVMIDLEPTEYTLVEFLMRNSEWPVTRDAS